MSITHTRPEGSIMLTNTITTPTTPAPSIEEVAPDIVQDAIISAARESRSTIDQSKGKVIRSWSQSGDID